MKNQLTYADVKSLEIFNPFVNRLAEISAKSTLKFLEQKDASNMVHDIRANIAHDCKYLATLEAIADDDRTEYKRDCLRNELRLLSKEATAIKREMKREQDENQLYNLNEQLAEIEAEQDSIQREIQRISAYLATIQPIISNTLSPNGYDLVNVARIAILTALQRSENAPIICKAIADYDKSYKLYSHDDDKTAVLDALMDDIKTTIVAWKKLKTKEGYTTFTLKALADKYVRNVINKQRSGIASKTNFMISGYDEQGNEQYIQADKMTTTGGITDVFRKDEFQAFRQALNLTPSEELITRLLMEGRAEHEIGARFGVSQQAIHKRIVKLRERLASYEEVKNMRRYHNSNSTK